MSADDEVRSPCEEGEEGVFLEGHGFLCTEKSNNMYIPIHVFMSRLTIIEFGLIEPLSTEKGKKYVRAHDVY